MEKISTKDMKRITQEISKSELKKYNIDAQIFLVTTLQYYTNYFFKNLLLKNNLNKNNFITAIKLPFLSSIPSVNVCFECDKNINTDIIIFIKKLQQKNKELFNLLFFLYHEIRHSIQSTLDDYSYEKFLYDIESVLIEYNWNDYLHYHDSYSLEIGAHIYGIDKTKEILKNKYPYIYQANKDNITKLEQDFKFDYMTYDNVSQIDKAIYASKQNQIKINDISPIFNIFSNHDNSFKNIQDIIQNPDFEKLDKRISYAFFSSLSYLESIDISTLSNEELSIINKSLQYTSTIYNNQYKFVWESFNEGNIKFKKFIKLAERLIKKIKTIDKYINLINTLDNQNQKKFKKI